MKNNSLAMIGTIAGIGILAWWIGFFDPETCTPDVQVSGWTSCEEIASQRTIGLVLLISLVILAAILALLRSRRDKR